MTDKSRLVLVTEHNVFGFRIALDPAMPRDRVDFVNPHGEVIGQITNLALSSSPTSKQEPE